MATDFMQTRFWLVRHAPVPGYTGRLYPDDDVAADVSDTQTFKVLASRLPKKAVWITSPQARAIQTVKAFEAAGYALPSVTEEPRISEIDFGDLAGAAYKDFETLLSPEDFECFCTSPAQFRAPGGESFEDVLKRTSECLEDICLHDAGKDVVLVTHASPIRAAITLALDIHPGKGLLINVDPLSLSRLNHIQGDHRLSYWTQDFVNLTANWRQEG